MRPLTVLVGAGPSAAVALALPLALLASGCALFHRQPPAPPPVVVIQAPILLPPPAYEAPAAPPAQFYPLADAVPDWLLALDALRAPAPPPARRATETARESRPDHQAPPAPANGPPPPQLTAGLNPAQLAAHRNRTLALLQQTQRELAVLDQRRLSAEGSATRSQAGEYVRQAQQALNQGDVVRAENLAQKAETLARFLLGG